MKRPALMLLSANSPYCGAGDGCSFEEERMCLTVVLMRGRASDSRSMETTFDASMIPIIVVVAPVTEDGGSGLSIDDDGVVVDDVVEVVE